MHTVSHHLFLLKMLKLYLYLLFPTLCILITTTDAVTVLVVYLPHWCPCLSVKSWTGISAEREREREIIYNKIKWFFNLNIDTGKWTGCWFLRLTSKLILTETPAHAHAHPQTNKHIHTLKHTHKVMFVSQYSEVIS